MLAILGGEMSVNYKLIMENVVKYIKKNFGGVELDENFDIDNDVYPKGYEKNVIEKEAENNSIDWLNNIEYYFAESTFLDEKILLARYVNRENEEKCGGYVIYLTQDDIYIDKRQLEEIVENTENTIEDVDLGMFIRMFKDEETMPLVNKKISKYDIENILCISYNESTNNHSYEEIKKLFSNMYIFKINSEYLNTDYELKDELFEVENIESFIYKLLGMIRCIDKIENINKELYFSEESLNQYLKLFNCTINAFPYENLYLSLCHNAPKFIFLEIYRMIEKLYQIIYSYNLKTEFNINSMELLEFNNIIECKYKIRHSEYDSISEIFNFIDGNNNVDKYVENLNSYKDKIDIGSKGMPIDSWIYKIRNTCVHLSFNKEKDINIKLILKEDTIIKNLIPIIGELYITLFN